MRSGWVSGNKTKDEDIFPILNLTGIRAHRPEEKSGSMTLVNDTLDYTENNVQYVQYGCLVWLGM